MFVCENELGVIVVFAQEGPEHGFYIKKIQSAFPDAIIEKDGRRYRAEFEFTASAFDTHGHDHRECDLVICWENDCTYTVLPTIALSNPSWMDTDLELPSDAEKAAHYWALRAMRAERALEALVKKQDGRPGQPTSYFCDVCNTYWPSQAALNGHQNAHRPKELIQ